ncbi:MAG: hypothetical protein PVI30_05380 [Myxococcales bacterium]
MSTLSQAVERLAATDALLREQLPRLHTLDPERERPTALSELARRLLRADDDPTLVTAYAETLERLARSQLAHFPENLFWDFDFAAAFLVRGGRGAGPAYLLRHAALFEQLQSRFGCRSPIRFRYVHDFAHGYDWERFVGRDPARHGDVGPLDLRFMQRMLGRGAEIAAAIEAGDGEFPPLPPGTYRNPFPFSRSPEHEVRLHRELARRGEIPVPTWRTDAAPDWRRPYSHIRLQRASELGIPRQQG